MHTDTTSSTDVVVAGGRVAGALAAARLAAAGLRVTVLDSVDVTSGTISTHFFRGDGLVRLMSDVGVLDEVLATGAPPLRRQHFYVGGHDTGSVDGPQEPGEAGFALSVRRATLDPILARHVANLPGITWLARRRVTDLLRDGDTVVGAVDITGAQHLAPLVVGADGRRSTVARLAGSGLERQSPPARFAAYVYVEGWASPDGGEPSAEFSLLGNEFAYAFPSDLGATCVALSVPIGDEVEARVDLEGWFGRRLGSHGAFRSRFSRARALGRVVAARPMSDFVRCAAGPGWALVGDAGTHQDPWSGLGMDTAARQAEALGRAVIEHGAGTAAMAVSYQRLRDEVTLERWAFTTGYAGDLSALAG